MSEYTKIAIGIVIGAALIALSIHFGFQLWFLIFKLGGIEHEEEKNNM